MKRIKEVLRRDKSAAVPTAKPNDNSTLSHLSSVRSSRQDDSSPSERIRPALRPSTVSVQKHLPHSNLVTGPQLMSKAMQKGTETAPMSTTVPLPVPRLQEHTSGHDPNVPFGSMGSAYSTGRARIPDEDLLGDASSGAMKPAHQSDSPNEGIDIDDFTVNVKGRRRKRNLNALQRRRVNYSIRRLSNLTPPHLRKDSTNLAVLETAVSWTQDLMWSLQLKLQRENHWKEQIKELGGEPYLADTEENVGESIIDRDLQVALKASHIDSFSSAIQRPHADRRASEPIQRQSIYKVKQQDHRPPRRIHKVTSRGSVISFVASVHSVTSLTYRSASGHVEIDTYEQKSTLEYFPDQKQSAALGQEGDIQQAGSPAEPAAERVSPQDNNAEAKLPVMLPTSERSDEVLRQVDSDIVKLGTTVDEAGDFDAGVTNESPYKNWVAGTDKPLPQLSKENIHLRTKDQSPASSSLPTHLQGLSENLGEKEVQAELNTLANDDHIVHGPRYSVTNLENGFVRLRWRCTCNQPFQIDVLEHQKGAAITTIQQISQHTSDHESGLPIQYRVPSYFRLGETISRLFSNSRARNDTLPKSNLASTAAGDLAKPPMGPSSAGPDRYICVCFPGLTYKKYLHHVDANNAADDPQLFAALHQKYYSWKPLWRRVMTLRTLARVEYFEFKVFYSNLVTIKDDWRDRFPHGHGPDEWAYTPTSRDMTPYLIDDVLTHYVHNPQCAKLGTYFWKRIPKKLFCQLECPDDRPFKVGWGLYFMEDFSQFYLLLILVPVLVGGVSVAACYCALYEKSFADGATVASGFTALVVYAFSVAQGWAKQKGSL